MSEPFEVKILGVLHGHASGWDELDAMACIVYDFVPDESSVIVPCDSLSINYDTGELEAQDKDSNIIETYKFVGEIKAIP